jgi:hypothetical protein
MFSWPELNGTFRGRPLHVYVFASGTHGTRQIYLSVNLTLKHPPNARLAINPSGTVGSFLGKIVKTQDVLIGNAEFDRRFVVKSDDPDFARRVLGSVAAQTGIQAIPDAYQLKLEGQSVEYSRRGVERDPELLMKVFNTLSDLADVMEAWTA